MSATPRDLAAFECAALLSRFAINLDSRNYDALLELVTPDCIWRGPKDTCGRTDILARLNARPSDMTTLHVVTNVAVDIVDDLTATARSYLTVYRFDGTSPLDALYPLNGPHTIAIYEDRFARIDGHWLISERRMTPIAQVQATKTSEILNSPTAKDKKYEVRRRRFGWLGWVPPC